MLNKETYKSLLSKIKIIAIFLIAIIVTFLIIFISKKGIFSTQDYAADQRIAATVYDMPIYEGDVSGYIGTFRADNGLSSDSKWADFLETWGFTTETVREAVIRYMSQETILEYLAKEQQCNYSDSEIEFFMAFDRSNGYCGQDVANNKLINYDELLQSLKKNRVQYIEERAEQAVLGQLETKYKEQNVSAREVALADEYYLDFINQHYDSEELWISYKFIACEDEETAQQVMNLLNNGADPIAIQNEYSILPVLNITDGVIPEPFSHIADDIQADISEIEAGHAYLYCQTIATDESIEPYIEIALKSVNDFPRHHYPYSVIYVTKAYQPVSGGYTSLSQIDDSIISRTQNLFDAQESGETFNGHIIDLSLGNEAIKINPMPDGLDYDIDIAHAEYDVSWKKINIVPLRYSDEISS